MSTVSAPGPARRIRVDRTVLTTLTLGLFAFYFTIQAGVIISYDGGIMANVGHNLWLHGSLHKYYGPGKSGGWSPYAVGMSLVTVPLWALQLHLAPSGEGWVSSANAFVTAATGGLLYLCGVELGWKRTTAVLAVLIFGLLTMAPLYSTELFSEPGMTFATVLALLGLLRWGRGRAIGPWLVAGALTLGVLFRSDAYVTVVAPALLLVPLFVPMRTLRATWARWLPPIAVSLAAVTAWTLAYDEIRFGSLFITSYGGQGFTNPILPGIYRQVLSPGKGFFWYDPILLVGLLGIVALYRRRRAVAITILAFSIVRVLLYAHWSSPDGSVAWGPRFLLPACALLALAVGEAIEWTATLARGPRFAARGLMVVLAGVSALVTLISVWVPYEQQHREYSLPATLPANHRKAVREVYRRQALTFNTWAHTPLRFGLDHLAHARRGGVGFPLRWWQGGYSAAGVAGLAAAVLLLSAAWWVAHRHPVGELHQPTARPAPSGDDGLPRT